MAFDDPNVYTNPGSTEDESESRPTPGKPIPDFTEDFDLGDTVATVGSLMPQGGSLIVMATVEPHKTPSTPTTSTPTTQ